MILKVKQDINQQEADRPAAEFSHQEHPDTWQCVDVRDLLFEMLERRFGPVLAAVYDRMNRTVLRLLLPFDV